MEQYLPDLKLYQDCVRCTKVVIHNNYMFVHDLISNLLSPSQNLPVIDQRFIIIKGEKEKDELKRKVRKELLQQQTEIRDKYQ